MDDLHRIVAAPVEHVLEACTNADDDIDVLPQRMARREAVAERIARVDDPLARAVADHGCLDAGGEPRDFRARALRTAADQDDRPLGASQQLRCSLDRVEVERRRPAHGRRVVEGDLGARAPHIPAAFETHGPWRAAQELIEGGAALRRGILGPLDMPGPFRERPHDPELIRDLVQETDPLADELLVDLAGNGEDRRAERLGCRERGGRIEETGAWDHAVGLGFAGGERRPERHVGRRLLVAGVNGLQRAAGSDQSIEEIVVLNPRQTIKRIETIRRHRTDCDLGGVHLGEVGR